MRVLYTVLEGVTRFNDWIGRWVSYLVLLMFVLLFLEVLLRYLLGAPTVWTGELGQMLFGAYAMLSGAYIMAQRGHVNVDILYAKLPRRAQAGLDILTSFLFFLFVWVLFSEGASLAMESVQRLERSQSAWNPPIWPVKLTIPIGAGLLLLQGLVKLIEDILTLIGRAPPGDNARSAPREEV